MIDAGEAVLYALLAENPSYFLTSSDKRAMRTIAQQPPLAPIYTAVAGRVICLETLLLALVKQQGVTTIDRALTPVQPLNTVLRIAFSAQCLAQPDECLQALTHYQQTLISEVDASFLWQPPV